MRSQLSSCASLCVLMIALAGCSWSEVSGTKNTNVSSQHTLQDPTRLLRGIDRDAHANEMRELIGQVSLCTQIDREGLLRLVALQREDVAEEAIEALRQIGSLDARRDLCMVAVHWGHTSAVGAKALGALAMLQDGRALVGIDARLQENHEDIDALLALGDMGPIDGLDVKLVELLNEHITSSSTNSLDVAFAYARYENWINLPESADDYALMMSVLMSKEAHEDSFQTAMRCVLNGARFRSRLYIYSTAALWPRSAFRDGIGSGRQTAEAKLQTFLELLPSARSRRGCAQAVERIVFEKSYPIEARKRAMEILLLCDAERGLRLSMSNVDDTKWRPPFARLVDLESPRARPAVDEVRPEWCLAILGGLPAGFIEGPLQGNTNAARMAAFFHAGRGSDIEWAAFDAQEMTLYVIGVRGAMEELVDQYPRIIEAVDLKLRTR